MGSRIMHLIIGNRIAERLAIEDQTSFLLGSVAPDAVQTKDESHFFQGEHENYTRHIDFQGFLEKYKMHADHPYVLGYFTHLVADDLWLKGFYIPWLRNRMEADAELYPLYHNDFRLLNGKLLEHYDCTDELRKAFLNSPEMIDLDEVKSSDVAKFMPLVLGYMDYKPEVIDEKLNVFSFVQIQGYIETAVNMGLTNLRRVLEACSVE